MVIYPDRSISPTPRDITLIEFKGTILHLLKTRTVKEVSDIFDCSTSSIYRIKNKTYSKQKKKNNKKELIIDMRRK